MSTHSDPKDLLHDAIVCIAQGRPWAGYADPRNIAEQALAEQAAIKPDGRERRLEAALIGLREFVVDRAEQFDGGSDGYEAQALAEAADEALQHG